MSEPSGARPRALVVGASRGLGAAVVRTLVAQGWLVAAASRNPGPAWPDASFAVRMDVTRPEEVREGVRAALLRLGGLEAVVYAVGWTESRPFAAEDEPYWRAVLDVNLIGAMRVAQAVLPLLRERRGSLVLVSSDAARVGTSRLAAYAAAKAGLLGLARSLALELARDGVRVNAVCPGLVATNLLASLGAESDPAVPGDDLARRVARRIPMRRVATAEEVAEVVAFLCGEGARYVTGQTWSVDGGLFTGG